MMIKATNARSKVGVGCFVRMSSIELWGYMLTLALQAHETVSGLLPAGGPGFGAAVNVSHHRLHTMVSTLCSTPVAASDQRSASHSTLIPDLH